MKFYRLLNVYGWTDEEDRNLRGAVEMYVLNLNAEKSRELGRDLRPEERFRANPAFATVLKDLNISKEFWWL